MTTITRKKNLNLWQHIGISVISFGTIFANKIPIDKNYIAPLLFFSNVILWVQGRVRDKKCALPPINPKPTIRPSHNFEYDFPLPVRYQIDWNEYPYDTNTCEAEWEQEKDFDYNDYAVQHAEQKPMAIDWKRVKPCAAERSYLNIPQHFR